MTLKEFKNNADRYESLVKLLERKGIKNVNFGGGCISFRSEKLDLAIHILIYDKKICYNSPYLNCEYSLSIQNKYKNKYNKLFKTIIFINETVFKELGW